MEDIVTLPDIESVWFGANFGPNVDKMNFVKYSLLKRACGYHLGSTITRILIDLGLITKKKHKSTSKGRWNLLTMFEMYIKDC